MNPLEYVYIRILKGLYCSEHNAVFKDRRDLMNHLRASDQVTDREKRGEIGDKLIWHQQKNQLSAEEEVLVQSYGDANEGRGKLGVTLPVISCLPVVERM